MGCATLLSSSLLAGHMHSDMLPKYSTLSKKSINRLEWSFAYKRQPLSATNSSSSCDAYSTSPGSKYEDFLPLDMQVEKIKQT